MENIFIALIGSLILLDTTILLQSAVSQPLILCTLLGFFFGDITLGLHIGIYLQLLWLSSLPVGAAVVPEGNMAAVVTAVMIFRYNHEMQLFNCVLILAVLYGLLLSYMGGEMVVLYRKNNVNLLNRLIARLHQSNIMSLPYTIVLSLLIHTLISFVFLSVSLFLGDYLFRNIAQLPPVYEQYAYFGAIGILAAGAGLLLHLYKGKWDRMLIVTGAIAGLIIPVL